MTFSESIKNYYYTVALYELRMMNQNALGPDISYNSLMYLDLISMTDHCTATKLAALLEISKPAVTSKVNELIAGGYVTKKQSETDKRVYFLTVGPAAEKIYKLYDKGTKRSADRVHAHFTEAEIATFMAVLKEMTDSYYSV